MARIINPFTHRLLYRPRQSEPRTRCDITSETLRLGAAIWIIQVKRRCRSYPGTAEARISVLVKTLLRSYHEADIWNSADLHLVRLWLLILCSISESTDQDRATSLQMMASAIEEPTLALWDEVMSNVRQMPWADIFDAPCVTLGQRLVKSYRGRMGNETC